MATITPTYDSAPSALTVTNLHSLSDAAAWQSDDMDNEATEDAVWADIMVRIGTTTTAGDATGYCDVYVAKSIEATPDYAGGASGSEGSYSPSPSLAEQLKNLKFIGRVACQADETTARTYEAVFSLPPFSLPQNWSIVIVNETGTGLAASGNEVHVSNNQGDAT